MLLTAAAPRVGSFVHIMTDTPLTPPVPSLPPDRAGERGQQGHSGGFYELCPSPFAGEGLGVGKCAPAHFICTKRPKLGAGRLDSRGMFGGGAAEHPPFPGFPSFPLLLFRPETWVTGVRGHRLHLQPVVYARRSIAATLAWQKNTSYTPSVVVGRIATGWPRKPLPILNV